MELPVSEVIRKRFSCRRYLDNPIRDEQQQLIMEFLAALGAGPFGTPVRLALIAASEQDRRSLKGLGTYGFIRRASGFIVGAVEQGSRSMEDFGYLMEQAILFITDLGLGTCWLGGSFTQSSFARKIVVTDREVVPAVTAVGYIADAAKAKESLRRQTERRLPGEQLFFEQSFGQALAPEAMGSYAEPLEMVRLAPSASNKQPWRVVHNSDGWHFYLQRTKGYGSGSLVFRLLRLADLQRMDIGIAMCHFELTARQLGLTGGWLVAEPDIKRLDDNTEYIVSWV